MFRVRLLIVLVLLASNLSFAQRSSAGRIPTGDGIALVVYVIQSNGQPAGEKINVRVDSVNGGTVGESFTNEEGYTTFVVGGGSYVIKVRGLSIKPVTSNVITIESMEKLHPEYIRVQTIEEGKQSEVETPSANIPANAREEFEMGTGALSKGDTAKAIEHYQKATKLYPRFAMAYNNLAALYMRSNDLAHAREAMGKALKADPDLPFTQANNIRLKLLEQNFDEAIALSQKALQKDPGSPEFLLLMCRSQLLGEHFDQAVAYAHKLTSAPHEKYESAHLLAARAFEGQKRLDLAKLEYEALIKDAPTSPEADEAQREIVRLKHLVVK